MLQAPRLLKIVEQPLLPCLKLFFDSQQLLLSTQKLFFDQQQTMMQASRLLETLEQPLLLCQKPFFTISNRYCKPPSSLIMGSNACSDYFVRLKMGRNTCYKFNIRHLSDI